MEINSQPETREIVLRDIDFTFIGSQPFTIVLRPEDTFEKQPDAFEVTISRTGERVTIFREHILWISERERRITEVLKGVA